MALTAEEIRQMYAGQFSEGAADPMAPQAPTAAGQATTYAPGSAGDIRSQYAGQFGVPGVGEERDYDSGIGYAFMRGFERLRALPDVAQGDYEELAGHYQAMDKWRMSDEDMARLEEIRETEGFWAKAGQLMMEPRLVLQTVAESLPMMAAPITGALGGGLAGGAMAGPAAPAGAIAGSMVGGGLGSYFTEYYNSVGEALSDSGVDLTDPNQLKAAFANEELMNKARDHAFKRGVPIAAFDALSMGLAGRIAKPISNTVGKVTGGRRVGAGITSELGMQAGFGMAGEAGAQLASEGEISDELDVLMEGFAELAPGVVEAGVSSYVDRKAEARKAGVQDPNESPLAALDQPEPESDEWSPVAATDIDPQTGRVVTRTGDPEIDELDAALEDGLLGLQMEIEGAAMAKRVAAEGAERAAERQGSRNVQMIEMEQERARQLEKQQTLEERQKEREVEEAYRQRELQDIEPPEAAEGEMVTPEGLPVEGEPIDVAGGQPAEEGMILPEGIVPPGGRPLTTNLGEVMREAGVTPPEPPTEPPAGGAGAPVRGPDVTPAEARATEALAAEVDVEALEEREAIQTEEGPVTVEPDVTYPEIPFPEVEPEAVTPEKPDVIKPTRKPDERRDSFLKQAAKKPAKDRLSMQAFEAEGFDIADMREPVYGGKPAFSKHPRALTPDDVAERLNEGGLYPNPYKDNQPGTWDVTDVLQAVQDEMMGLGEILTYEAGEVQVVEQRYADEVEAAERQAQERAAGPATLDEAVERAPTPVRQRGQEDMFGAPSETAQAVADRERERKEKERAAPEADTGALDDLFTAQQTQEQEQAQTDLADEARAAAAREKGLPEGFVPREVAPSDLDALAEETDTLIDKFAEKGEQNLGWDQSEILGGVSKLKLHDHPRAAEIEQRARDLFEEPRQPAEPTEVSQEDIDEFHSRVKAAYRANELAGKAWQRETKNRPEREKQRDQRVEAVLDMLPTVGVARGKEIIQDYHEQHIKQKGTGWGMPEGLKRPFGFLTGPTGPRDTAVGEQFQKFFYSGIDTYEVVAKNDKREIALVKTVETRMTDEDAHGSYALFPYDADSWGTMVGGVMEEKPADYEPPLGATYYTRDQAIQIFEAYMEGRPLPTFEDVTVDEAGGMRTSNAFFDGFQDAMTKMTELDVNDEINLAASPYYRIDAETDGDGNISVALYKIEGVENVLVESGGPTIYDTLVDKFTELSATASESRLRPTDLVPVGPPIPMIDENRMVILKGDTFPKPHNRNVLDEAQFDTERFDKGNKQHLANPEAWSMRKKTSKMKFGSASEARAKLKEWKAHAKAVGETGVNNNKVVISLFDATGTWSQPYVDAGYRVIQYDSFHGNDIHTIDWFREIEELRDKGYDIAGVLAAPPCTSFASAGARWWGQQHDTVSREWVKKKYGEYAAFHYDKPIEYAEAIVKDVWAIIEMARPSDFYAMENPSGRLRKVLKRTDEETGKEVALDVNLPSLSFDPWHFGDPYTKRTHLWGEMDTALPLATVVPVEGSKMHMMSSGAERVGGERSATPEGFAYAFFMANHNVAPPGTPTEAGPVNVPSPAEIDQAANEAAPDEATQAQKEAGNYKKGHLTIGGLDFAIENPAGTVRHGNMKLRDHYGYIKRTVGKDGDQVDVFINSNAQEDWAGDVYVVDQIFPEVGGFDEHKVMFGYNNMIDARRAYKRNFNKDWKGQGAVTKMTLDEFKAWLAEPGAKRRPASLSSVTEAGRKARQKAGKDLRYSAGKDGANAPTNAWVDAVLNPRDKEGKPIHGDIADTMPMNVAVSELLALQAQREGAPAAPARPTFEAISRSLQPIEDRMPGAPVTLLHNYKQAPPAVVKTMQAEGMTQVKAVYDPQTNEIFMFADQIESVDEAQRTSLHEKAHRGLRKAFGERLNPLLDDVFANANEKRQANMQTIIDRYKLDPTVLEDQRVIAEELLAHMAEHDVSDGMLNRAVAFIRKLLRDMGVTLEFTDNDIRALIREAQGAVRRTDRIAGVTIEEEVILDDTGEVYIVEQDADVALTGINQRIEICKKLRACL